jgi:hypothetical protein
MPTTLTRAPAQQYSNTLNPNGPGPWQWYEKTYTSTGQQEWIYLPDGGFPAGIVLSGSGGWAASVYATDSPPDQVAAGSAVTYAWPIGIVSTTSNATISGATAISVYVTTVGTNVKLSVRV